MRGRRRARTSDLMIRSPPPRWDTVLDRIASDAASQGPDCQIYRIGVDQSAGDANIEQRPLSISPYGRYGIFGRGRADHSGLMLANFTTLAHFSMSSAMNLPNSADEVANAV